MVKNLEHNSGEPKSRGDLVASSLLAVAKLRMSIDRTREASIYSDRQVLPGLVEDMAGLSSASNELLADVLIGASKEQELLLAARDQELQEARAHIKELTDPKEPVDPDQIGLEITQDPLNKNATMLMHPDAKLQKPWLKVRQASQRRQASA